MRALFLLLLVANIACYAWFQVLAPAPARSVAGPVPLSERPGVARLQLLAEHQAQQRAAALAASPQCFSLGPLETQSDQRRALANLPTGVLQSNGRQTFSMADRGFWVFLPALENRDRALTVARQLSGIGVRDYYVVTAGEQENTISLGLFRDQGNAIRRRDDIRRLGFDAELEIRREETPVYWVDVVLPREATPDWARLRSALSTVSVNPQTCEL